MILKEDVFQIEEKHMVHLYLKLQVLQYKRYQPIHEEFLDFFEEFWVSKGSLLQEREKLEQELRGYRDADAFGITEAFVKGQKVVYHTHILDTDIVRLLHSASLYRLEEDDVEGKNLIGIANRYLHFEEMKYVALVVSATTIL